MLFRSTNYEVISAQNGEEGLQKAIKEQPDIILLDIIMPEINGLDVLHKLKTDHDTATIPVLMLTNLPKDASFDKAKSLGATDYFVKADFEPDKLAEAVKNLIGQ